MSTDTREALAALQRLMPAIEKGIGGLVFTADKAGEIAADMNTLRAALATQPAQPSTLVERSDAEILVLADKLFPMWREDIQPQFVLRLARAVLADATVQSAQPVNECADNDSPWLVCKKCVAAGQCEKAAQPSPAQIAAVEELTQQSQKMGFYGECQMRLGIGRCECQESGLGGECIYRLSAPKPAQPSAQGEVDHSGVAVCGYQTAIPVDADLIGCGKPIATHAEVYRCTDCSIPFHRECAKRHFETDTPENAQKVYAEQLRRLDAASAPAAPAQPSAQGEAVAWLVEWKALGHGPQWWGFNHTPGKSATWCSDANNAIRFARKEDAERMRLHIIAVAGLTGMHEYERSISVTEHIWEGPCRAN